MEGRIEPSCRPRVWGACSRPTTNFSNQQHKQDLYFFPRLYFSATCILGFIAFVLTSYSKFAHGGPFHPPPPRSVPRVCNYAMEGLSYRLTICDVIWNCQTVILSNCQTVKLLNCQTVKLSNCQTVKLSKCQTNKLFLPLLSWTDFSTK